MRAVRGLETLLVGFACEHTRPANEEMLASEASMALEGKNGSLALGWSLYTCLPPCPKADLGTSIPLLSPKRGIKPETRALLQCQSSTAPGNPSHRKLSAAPTLPSLRGTPSLPPCPPPPRYLHHHCFHIGRTE